MVNKTPIVIVAGMSKGNRAIGKENGLLWHVPDDMKRFKALTMGHPVIMGRKTFESIVEILGRPLPGRTNIVITRNSEYTYEGVRIAASLDEALAVAKEEHPAEIHIGGGEEIYRQVLPLVDRLHITYFFEDKDGDAFFLRFEDQFDVLKEYEIMEHNGLQYQWVDYVRTPLK